MKYLNLKKLGYTTEKIAKGLGYKNANSFRNSSKYKRTMLFLDEVASVKD